MYLGRNMGCKKIFLLFVLRWCWWCSTPICPQLKLRARILQVNCTNVFFIFQCINLKTTVVCFQVKKLLIFFPVHIFSLQIYSVFSRWHSFFYWIHTYFMCSWWISQSQISGLGCPECHRTAGWDHNLWPALQDYPQANLFSQLFLLHAGIRSSVRKDSEGATSSPHHSAISSKSEKKFFNMRQGRQWWVLNANIWIIYFSNLNR